MISVSPANGPPKNRPEQGALAPNQVRSAGTVHRLLLALGFTAAGLVALYTASRLVGREAASTVKSPPTPSEHRLSHEKNSESGDSSPSLPPLPSSADRKRILAGLESSRDKFQQVTFYLARHGDSYRSRIEAYIAESDSGYTLRIRIVYRGLHWIFWNKLSVEANGRVATLSVPWFDVKRDMSTGIEEESVDMPIASAAKDAYELTVSQDVSAVFGLLAAAKTASVRLEGQQIEDRALQPEELHKFQDVARRFMALYGIRDDRNSLPGEPSRAKIKISR